MENYKNLVQKILKEGELREDRTGTGTMSIFGEKLEWDLTRGFPATTTKRLAWKSVVSELLWFLSGSDNVDDLREILHGTRERTKDTSTIWDANYDKQARELGYDNGHLGPIYGVQWRDFNGIDQIQELIKELKENPAGRRHLVSAWNVSHLDDMALPPCHWAFQVHVDENGGVSLMWHQRSVDVFLGLPFNIASYALLTHIIAKLIGGYAKRLVFTGGDCHIYKNHTQQCFKLLENEPLDLPNLKMPTYLSLENYINCDISEFELVRYKNHGTIKAPMSA